MSAALSLACPGPGGAPEGHHPVPGVPGRRRQLTPFLFLPCIALGIAGMLPAFILSGAELPPQPPRFASQPPQSPLALPPDLLAAEDSLAAGHFRAAARDLGAIATDPTRPAPLRARAARGKGAAHWARLEMPESIAALGQAVVLDPGFIGNPAVLERIAELVDENGLPPGPPGMDELLTALDGAAATTPALRAGVTRLHVLTLRIGGRFDDAEDRAAGLHPVTDFAVIGPFDYACGAGLEEPYPPEAGVDLAATILDSQYHTVGWMLHPPLYAGRVHTGVFFDGAGVLAYAAAAFRPPAPGPAILHLSGEGAFRLWLNGELVLDEPKERARDQGFDLYADQDLYEVPVELAAGWNQLLVKVGSRWPGHSVMVRCTDPAGNPLAVECSAEPPSLRSSPVRPLPPTDTLPRGLARFPETSWLRRWSDQMPEASLADRALFIRALLARDFEEEAASAVAAAFTATTPAVGAPGTALGPPLLEEERIILLLAQEASAEHTPRWRGRTPRKSEADEAVRLAARAPEHFSAHLALIRVLIDQYNSHEAWSVINPARATFGSNPILTAFHGRLEVERGKQQAGLAEIERAVRAAPGNRQIRAAQFEALEEEMQDKSALAAARLDALRYRADEDYLAGAAGEAAEQGGDTDEALRHWEHALRAGGRPTFVRGAMAHALREDGRLEEAVAVLEESRRWSPFDEAAVSNLAAIRIQQGKMDEAKRLLARVIELDPTYSFDARARLRELEGGHPLRELFPSGDVTELARADLSWADPGAGAIMLLSSQDILCYPDGANELWLHFVVKVRSQSGIDDIDKFFPEVSGLSRHPDLNRAHIIKPDGRVVAEDDRVDFEELAPGDLVELFYTIQDAPKPGLDGHSWSAHYFQHASPCLRSRVCLLAPKGSRFESRLHSIAIEPQVSTFGEWQLSTWEAEKLPALVDDDYGSAYEERAAWIETSTVPSWDTIARWYDQASRTRIRSTVEIRALAAALADSARARSGLRAPAVAPDSVLIRAVMNFMQHNIRFSWNDQESVYLPKAAAAVLEESRGECKDQAALVVSLLRELGIEAQLALAYPGDGMGVPLPSTHFSHAITRARTQEGRVYWLDPQVEHMLQFPHVFTEIEGAQALVMGPGPARFVSIPAEPASQNGHDGRSEAAVDGRGRLSLSGSCRLFGGDAFSLAERTRLDGGTAAAMKDLLDQAYPTAIIGKSTLVADDGGDAMVLDYELANPAFALFAADLMIIKVPWVRAMVPVGMVAAEKREIALDLGFWKGRYREVIRMSLPSGYRVHAMPRAVELRSAAGSYSLRTRAVGAGAYEFERVFEIDARRVETAGYEEFRRFVIEVQRADQEPVVLERDR